MAISGHKKQHLLLGHIHVQDVQEIIPSILRSWTGAGGRSICHKVMDRCRRSCHLAQGHVQVQEVVPSVTRSWTSAGGRSICHKVMDRRRRSCHLSQGHGQVQEVMPCPSMVRPRCILRALSSSQVMHRTELAEDHL